MSSLADCSYCGAQNLESIDICRSCGHSVAEVPPKITKRVGSLLHSRYNRIETLMVLQFLVILLLALWTWNLSAQLHDHGPSTQLSPEDRDIRDRLQKIESREADRQRFGGP